MLANRDERASTWFLPRDMVEAATYSAMESLRDGRSIEIRSIRPADKDELLSAVKRASTLSLYRRFFGVKRNFTSEETAFFVNVDFVKHVALVAVATNSGASGIVGGGRYVVIGPGRAELAFTVVDEYQGLGIGSALLRHLATIAFAAGLRELVAEVLPDNKPMLKVFEKNGFHAEGGRRDGVVHVGKELTR